jgi:hypothetical protein
MLRVTVELLPGGREHDKRVLAHADISEVKTGALADYRVRQCDNVLVNIGTAFLSPESRRNLR